MQLGAADYLNKTAISVSSDMAFPPTRMNSTYLTGIDSFTGDDIVTYQMANRLQEEGVFVNSVVTPAVPPGHGVIRTSYMATHTREHLDQALGVIAKVGRELSII